MENKDFNYLNDQEFLKAKKRITKEITTVLAKTEEKLKSVISNTAFEFPERTFARTGKISKGENYQDLPYFILDFPRKFSKSSSFAYRVMVWWGNEISTTLHLGGDVSSFYSPIIQKKIPQIKDHYICVHDEPWEYHFDKSNYIKIGSLNQQDISTILEEKDFIKLSLPFPLSDINQLPQIAAEQLEKYLELLADH